MATEMGFGVLHQEGQGDCCIATYQSSLSYALLACYGDSCTKALTAAPKKPWVVASSCAHFSAAGSLLMAMFASSIITDNMHKILLYNQETHLAVAETHPAAVQPPHHQFCS